MHTRHNIKARPGLLLALLLVHLAGCQQFQPRPIEPADNLDQLERRSLSDAGLQSFLKAQLHREAGGWNLESLTLVALYFHPDLDVARAQLAGARAARHMAGERPNPSLGVSPSYNSTATVPTPWLVAASLDIPIETAGKRGYRLAQAAHLSDAARFSLAATAWQVRSRVRKGLLALHGAQESETLLNRQEAIQSESVRLVGAQLAAGAVSPFEVTQARVALNQVRFARLDAEKQAVSARGQLAEALGLPPAALASVTPAFDEFKQFPGDLPDAAARRQALVSRADVLAALAEYAATQSALQLEIARQYPDVRLNPGYDYDQGNSKWSLGLSVELPVLNQNQGRIAEAGAKREVAAAKFTALQARVLSEIEQAIAGYRALLKKAGAAKTLSHELERQLRAAKGMLAAGEISRVELAQRQLELTTAALAQHAALISAQEALGTLEDALQNSAPLLPPAEPSPRHAFDFKP